MAQSNTFHEPGAQTLLILVSFLYLLPVAKQIAEVICSAGLLGEIGLGIIYGSPLAAILDKEWEATFMVIGYLGLILIVFEAGLEIDPAALMRFFPISFAVALIGIICPISFTFAILYGAFGYPALHCFSAGAALASTSLGTTLFVLSSKKTENNDISKSAVGFILTSAALIDDVIALVLLTVVSALGEGVSQNDSQFPWIVANPIVSSIAMAIISPLLARYILRYFYRKYLEPYLDNRHQWPGIFRGDWLLVFIGVCVLSAHVSIAYYTNTTMLLGAFLAGVMLHLLPCKSSLYLSIYSTHIGQLQHKIFVPFFFASIGYCIPFLSLMTAEMFWKGLVYSIFMTLGKVMAGIPLIIWPASFSFPKATTEKQENGETEFEVQDPEANTIQQDQPEKVEKVWYKNTNLISGCMIGMALVARGEIGLLILQVARTAGDIVMNEEVYLIAVWAVAICTIVGPVAFAQMVRFFAKYII